MVNLQMTPLVDLQLATLKIPSSLSAKCLKVKKKILQGVQAYGFVQKLPAWALK